MSQVIVHEGLFSSLKFGKEEFTIQNVSEFKLNRKIVIMPWLES